MAESIKDFTETTIPQAYSTGLYSQKQYNVAKEHVWKILDMVVNGITEVLRDLKAKEHPVAFVIKNRDDFLLAAVVQYIPNEEDPSNPGSWSMQWTFDEADVPTERTRIITPYDADISSYFWAYGMNHYDMGFKSAEYLGTSTSYLIQLIKKWLDENASETDTVGVTLPDVVTFKVQVENGEKFFGCEVDGEIKQRIKDDASIET